MWDWFSTDSWFGALQPQKACAPNAERYLPLEHLCKAFFPMKILCPIRCKFNCNIIPHQSSSALSVCLLSRNPQKLTSIRLKFDQMSQQVQKLVEDQNSWKVQLCNPCFHKKQWKYKTTDNSSSICAMNVIHIQITQKLLTVYMIMTHEDSTKGSLTLILLFYSEKYIQASDISVLQGHVWKLKHSKSTYNLFFLNVSQNWTGKAAENFNQRLLSTTQMGNFASPPSDKKHRKCFHVL